MEEDNYERKGTSQTQNQQTGFWNGQISNQGVQPGVANSQFAPINMPPNYMPFYPMPPWNYQMQSQSMYDELYRRQQEAIDDKEYQEIYDYIKKKQKNKYKAKIEKLQQQIKEAAT